MSGGRQRFRRQDRYVSVGAKTVCFYQVLKGVAVNFIKFESWQLKSIVDEMKKEKHEAPPSAENGEVAPPTTPAQPKEAPVVKTQADRLAEMYTDIFNADAPKAMVEEAIAGEIDENGELDKRLPKLAVTVKDKANLVAQVPAIIFSANKLYYFELACTSSATAHAFAGAIAEDRIAAQWRIFWNDLMPGAWVDVEIGGDCQINDTRLAVPGWSKLLHHVAVLDRSGELFIADTDEILWEKLRVRMSCPTLSAWGPAVLARIKRSGMLIETKTYGIPESMKAYVLAPDANELFDQIIGEHVRTIGGL